MGKPAARLTDPTAHGGLIVGPGVPTVLIGKMPAATMGDNHVCPMMTPGTPPIPHVGGPITLGSTGVFIGKKPAARMGDMAVCVGPPATVIMGCPTVLIGEAGSGSQAGSAAAAGKAAAASVSAVKSLKSIALKSAKTAAKEVHQIQVSFVDSAGRPLAATPFFLKDPDGQTLPASSDSEGGYIKGGYAEKGRSFEVSVPSLSAPRWSGSAKDGETLEMRCDCPSVPDGQRAMFQVEALTESGQRFLLHDHQAIVASSALTVSWTFSEASLDPIRSQSGSDVRALRFFACCGSLAAVSPELSLTAGKGKYGSSARARLGGTWFAKDSDLLLPSAASRLRRVARFLQSHPGATVQVLIGKAGPSDEASPSSDLTSRRGRILASILTGSPDVFLRRFAEKTWADLQAQLLLSDLLDPSGTPWLTGPATSSWSETSRSELGRFQTEHGLVPGNPVDARFGIKLFELLHEAACAPRARRVALLVGDPTPELAEGTPLEIHVWTRGKGPTPSEFRQSAQSVLDEMDRCVILDLSGKTQGWSM